MFAVDSLHNLTQFKILDVVNMYEKFMLNSFSNSCRCKAVKSVCNHNERVEIVKPGSHQTCIYKSYTPHAQ